MAVGEHSVVKATLPPIIGILLTAALLVVGLGLLLDRDLSGCMSLLAARIAPGNQATQDLDFAIGDYARAAIGASHGGDLHDLADASDRLRSAGSRYDGWLRAAGLDGVTPIEPAVESMQRRLGVVAFTELPDVAVLDEVDRLARMLRANTTVMTDDAVRALERASRLEAERRWMEIVVFGLLAAGCTMLLFAAHRREARVTAGETESARRLEQANADLEAFAGRIAHDLRNPLVPILSGSQIIERADETPPRVKKTAERIEKSARRLSGMIDTLLDFSRLRHAKAPESSDVRAVVEEVLEPFRERAAAESVKLCVDVPPLRVACEPIVLSSALQNLVENAFKYGRCPDREPVVQLRAYQHDGCVHIEVEDNGPGITPTEAETLFQPFRRGEHPGDGGVGLGLATARRLVEARGGSILLRAGADGGALFTVHLPQQPQPTEERASA